MASFMETMVDTIVGSVFIPSTHDFAETSPFSVAYDNGVSSTMTVFDLTNVYSLLPPMSRAPINKLSYMATYNELQTPEYLQAKEEFNQKTIFLCGDLDHGGIFCWKNIDNNLMYIGVVYCFGNKTIDGDVYYWHEMGLMGDPEGLSQLDSSQVAISFDTSSNVYDDVFPSFYIHTTSLGNPLTVWDLDVDLLPVPSFNYIATQNITSLASAVDITSYYDKPFTEDDLPYQTWRASKVGQISGRNPEFNEFQGSWTGDAEISLKKDPSWKGGTSNSGGGNGDYPTKSDDTRPDNPNASGIDAIGTGFITLYNPTKEQVKAFNDFLFSDSITSEISNQLKKLIADPIDYLVFIAMCHFKPTTNIVGEVISFVGISTGVSAKIIPAGEQMFVLDCGTVHIGEDTNSARDYSPYSKAQIFIPYVGFKELNIEEIRGSDVHVTYHIDLLTGGFACHVWVERPVRVQWQPFKDAQFTGTIGVFEGNCYEMLPLSSTDFRNFYTGLMGVIGGGVSVASGNLGGLGAMGSSVMSMKTNVNRSGNATASFGYNSKQKPFILLTRPFQAIPYNMGSYEGYPSNIYGEVSKFKGGDGYLETDENTVWGTDITYEYGNSKTTAFDVELDEIKQLFNSGVYINV